MIVSYNFPGMLAYLTGTAPVDWEETEGPDSGVGVDYWYVCAGRGETLTVNVDQGVVTIELDDGTVVFDPDLGDLDDPESLARFVSVDDNPEPNA